MIWNPVTDEGATFTDYFEAKAEARRRGWRIVPADSCTNCGGELDVEGWCANYCTDDVSSDKEGR